MKLKIKAFLIGFDYAIKHYDKIEDHHFHSLPGATWHDKSTQKIYRDSIKFGRKYMQYRYEILAFCMIFMGIVILITI
jgi:hypothetical protein